MAVVRYHRYVGELWEDLNLEDLVSELSDFLLQSGFGQEELSEWSEDTLQALHDALLEALPFHAPRGGGALGEAGPPVRFELTQKALDFLGYRALRDLLGAVGKSSFGRHDTRAVSPGIEASCPTNEGEV